MRGVHAIATLLACVGVAACDSGRWVEVPPMMMNCKDLTADTIQALKNRDKISMERSMAQGMCQQAGAKQFAGGSRCRDEHVELRCTD